MFTESAYFEIETDGRVVFRSRDPPGQRSIYIPPGDTCREIYRLSTFKSFPRGSSADPRSLAANGFYFTGYKDRVKCFSCGQTSENWNFEDDPCSSEWHIPECDFFNGRSSGNEPIHASLFRLGFASQSGESGRASSSRQQPTNQEDHVAPHTWQSQQERPSSCELRPADSHEPETNSLRASLLRPEANSNPLDLSVDFDTNESANLCRELFPCLNPISPHMRSKEARMQTFIEHSIEWSRQRVNVSPEDIVEAGMFYLGERDRVKCWYCNGGLQNWKNHDIPWEEHAKWFPKCEFILQSKGPQFVSNIVTRYPNLRRPAITNPAQNSHFPAQNNSMFSRSSQTSHNIYFGNPNVIDPKKEEEKRKNQIEKDLNSSELIAEVKQMGFDHNIIRAVLKRQYEEHNTGFSSVENIVESVLAFNSQSQQNSVTLPTAERRSSPIDAGDPPAGAQRSREHEPLGDAELLRELESSRNCKLCGREPANVVFIPCGHLVTCDACSARRRNCPVCQSFIREKVRSYIA